MSYQSDTYTALTGSSAITALVSSRIYADVADGSASTPYLVYQFISAGGETTHDGERDTEFPLIQLTAWATSKASAIAIADAVRNLLEGNTIAGDSASSFQHSNRFGTYEDDTKLFGEILEYRMQSKI